MRGIKFSLDSWTRLCKGLNSNKTITKFILSFSIIQTECFPVLASVLAKHPSIEIIQMNDDYLDDCYAEHFYHIITGQCQRRCETKWKNELRKEFYSENPKRTGLFELILNSNRLSDKTINQIALALCSDQFITKIDLSQNMIKLSGINNFINKINENNHSLINVDISKNPGATHEKLNRLACILVRNLQAVKSDPDYFEFIVKHKWIDKTVLEISPTKPVRLSFFQNKRSVSASPDKYPKDLKITKISKEFGSESPLRKRPLKVIKSFKRTQSNLEQNSPSEKTQRKIVSRRVKSCKACFDRARKSSTPELILLSTCQSTARTTSLKWVNEEKNQTPKLSPEKVFYDTKI